MAGPYPFDIQTISSIHVPKMSSRFSGFCEQVLNTRHFSDAMKTTGLISSNTFCSDSILKYL